MRSDLGQISYKTLFPGRKGKNRCEMDPNSNSAACKRCLASNTACVFEKITDKARGRNSSIAAAEGLSGDAEG